MPDDLVVFRFGDFKTLPIYTCMGRTLETIEAFSKGEVAVEYVDPDYDPPNYDIASGVLAQIGADPLAAIEAIRQWPSHFSKFLYFVQFKDDPSRRLLRALHCHTELVSTLCDARLGIDSSLLWEPFDSLCAFESIHSEYRADQERESKYSDYASRLALAFKGLSGHPTQATRLTMRMVNQIELKASIWHQLPPLVFSATNPILESYCDIGIIVALKEEFRELHRELPSPHVVKDETMGSSDYLFAREIGDGLTYSCAATFVGSMGPTEAALATERFINRRQPNTIVMLGIAAGIDDDVKLGDVVISTHVGRYLDRAKIEQGNGTFDIKPGGDSFPCSSELLRATQDFEFAHQSQYSTWQVNAAATLRELVTDEALTKLMVKDWIAEKPRFLEGAVASGPVVAAAGEFVEWIKSLNRQYLALEMEGGAMLAAVYSRADPKRSMMLRGISDFGDKRKKELDEIGKGGLRRYATRNAIITPA